MTYTVRQFAILRLLYNVPSGFAETQEILDILEKSGRGMPRSNLSSGANRLASFGLIERAYKKGKNGKKCVYSITQKGRGEIEAFDEVGVSDRKEIGT